MAVLYWLCGILPGDCAMLGKPATDLNYILLFSVFCISCISLIFLKISFSLLLNWFSFFSK